MKIDCQKYQDNLIKLNKLFGDFQMKVIQGDIKKAKQLQEGINETMLVIFRKEYDFVMNLKENLSEFLDGKISESFDLGGQIVVKINKHDLINIMIPSLEAGADLSYEIAATDIYIDNNLFWSIVFNFKKTDRIITYSTFSGVNSELNINSIISEFLKKYFYE